MQAGTYALVVHLVVIGLLVLSFRLSRAPSSYVMQAGQRVIQAYMVGPTPRTVLLRPPALHPVPHAPPRPPTPPAPPRLRVAPPPPAKLVPPGPTPAELAAQARAAARAEAAAIAQAAAQQAAVQQAAAR
ncbi:MAG: hypothetical protein ACYCXG_12575, partial [Acidiferrobacter sp.]